MIKILFLAVLSTVLLVDATSVCEDKPDCQYLTPADCSIGTTIDDCPELCDKAACDYLDTCEDLNNGATDTGNDGCAAYAIDPTGYTWCGNYDDDDFQSEVMCCACGGGLSQDACEDSDIFCAAYTDSYIDFCNNPMHLVEASTCKRTCFEAGNIVEGCSAEEGDDSGDNSTDDNTYGPWTSWGLCTETCDSGEKYRTRTCSTSDGSDCDTSLYIDQMMDSETCNEQACPASYSWVEGAWSVCTLTCDGGMTYRNVHCENDDNGDTVDGALCTSPEPADSEICNAQACAVAAWVKGQWGTCSTTCGDGTQSRIVDCELDGSAVPTADCTEAEPSATQSCNLEDCAVGGDDCKDLDEADCVANAASCKVKSRKNKFRMCKPRRCKQIEEEDDCEAAVHCRPKVGRKGSYKRCVKDD